MSQPAESKPQFTMEGLAREYQERALQELLGGAEYRLLLPVPVLARVLGVNLTRAYQLTKVEGFPSLIIGKRILVPIIPLLAYLQQQANLPLEEQEAAGLGKGKPGRARPGR